MVWFDILDFKWCRSVWYLLALGMKFLFCPGEDYLQWKWVGVTNTIAPFSWSYITSHGFIMFSLYGDVENMSRFRAMGEFHAPVNFYSPRDAMNAFHKLQGHQIYENCSELDLYFASEFICGCRQCIPCYKLDCDLWTT